MSVYVLVILCRGKNGTAVRNAFVMHLSDEEVKCVKKVAYRSRREGKELGLPYMLVWKKDSVKQAKECIEKFMSQKTISQNDYKVHLHATAGYEGVGGLRA